ncbi:MAG: Exodeoxyribonuclease [Legionellaceae bacterium]
MKIITINVNGIRSAASKGLFEWLVSESADMVCVQETKSQEHQLGEIINKLQGYHPYFFDAQKKGYSGVALFLKQVPHKLHYGLGWDCADQEGRYIQADYENFSIASLYMPSGSSGEERQAKKFEFLKNYTLYLKKLRDEGKEIIIAGDWNIAHKAIDLKNWRSNQKNSGFLPEERAWMDEVLGPLGFIDAFRLINSAPEEYTWWSNRGQAWQKNVGWRIDYQIITPGLKEYVQAAQIYKEQRFSDHAPLIINYGKLIVK